MSEIVIKNTSQGEGLIIEELFPEVANLYGDTGNFRYLKKCLPAATFVSDSLNEEPHFVKKSPSLIYMGPMSEHAQELVIDRLMKYKSDIERLISEGVIFLFTGNAMEVLFTDILNEDGTKIMGLGIFNYEARRMMFHRYNRHCMGTMNGIEIVGYKNQFTHSYGDNSKEYFFDVTKGDGLNRENNKEGIRRNNFIGTYLLGPLFIQNPKFTEYIMKLMGIENPELAFADTINAAYDLRLKEYKAMEFEIYGVVRN